MELNDKLMYCRMLVEILFFVREERAKHTGIKLTTRKPAGDFRQIEVPPSVTDLHEGVKLRKNLETGGKVLVVFAPGIDL